MTGYDLVRSFRSEESSPPVSGPWKWKGIIILTLTSVFSTTQASLLKYLKFLPTGEVITIVGFYAICFFVVLMCYSGSPFIHFPRRMMVFARVSIGALGYVCKVWSYMFLPLGDASAIIFTLPIFTGLMGRLVLKEKLNLSHFAATVLSIIGICLIAKPSFLFSSNTPKDYPTWQALIPLSAAFFLSVAYVLQRKIGKDVSGISIAFYMVSCQMVAGILFHLVSRVELVNPPCFTPRIVFVLDGLCLVGFFVCLNKGLSMERVIVSSLMRNLDVIFAFLVQVVIFRSGTNLLSVVGAVLILSGTSLAAISKAFSINCGLEF